MATYARQSIGEEWAYRMKEAKAREGRRAEECEKNNRQSQPSCFCTCIIYYRVLMQHVLDQ